jgi:hypothetical protein
MSSAGPARDLAGRRAPAAELTAAILLRSVVVRRMALPEGDVMWDVLGELGQAVREAPQGQEAPLQMIGFGRSA